VARRRDLAGELLLDGVMPDRIYARDAASRRAASERGDRGTAGAAREPRANAGEPSASSLAAPAPLAGRAPVGTGCAAPDADPVAGQPRGDRAPAEGEDPAQSPGHGAGPARALAAAGLPVAAWVERGRRAWPGVAASEAGLTAAAADALAAAPAGGPPPVVEAEDLYLAVACLEGDPAALVAFRDRILPAIDGALLRAGHDRRALDEIRQRVSVRLLVGEGSSGPKLADYSGRGKLAGWVAVCAVRLALRARLRDRLEPEEDERLAARLGGVDDVERGIARAQLHGELAAALRGAIASLAPRDRRLLAQHYLDGVTLDGLAALHGTHRATIARRLARARDALRTTVRTIVKARCQIDDTAECDRMICDARSGFNESLGGALCEGERAP
jgi:RNA polymerase sigma-70 factor (ECF subfamily)